MTQVETQFMADNRYDLHELRNLGEAFAAVCQHFGTTPKAVARQIGQDPRTARNALEGKAGTPVITSALQARQKTHDDHYDLALAMLAMIFGETHEQYEERKLQLILEEASNAKNRFAARQDVRRSLRSRASSPYCGDADRPRVHRLD